MTERAWQKLVPGDRIVNKRSAGIVLTVLKRFPKSGDMAGGIRVESNGQQHDLSDLAYLEYQQVLPQERLPL